MPSSGTYTVCLQQRQDQNLDPSLTSSPNLSARPCVLRAKWTRRQFPLSGRSFHPNSPFLQAPPCPHIALPGRDKSRASPGICALILFPWRPRKGLNDFLVLFQLSDATTPIRLPSSIAQVKPLKLPGTYPTLSLCGREKSRLMRQTGSHLFTRLF